MSEETNIGKHRTSQWKLDVTVDDFLHDLCGDCFLCTSSDWAMQENSSTKTWSSSGNVILWVWLNDNSSWKPTNDAQCTDYDNNLQMLFIHHWYSHPAMEEGGLARCRFNAPFRLRCLYEVRTIVVPAAPVL